MVEKPEIVTDKHLEFLDGLRESGITNMFGAAPYIQNEFGVNNQDAYSILTYWIKTFSERHNK